MSKTNTEMVCAVVTNKGEALMKNGFSKVREIKARFYQGGDSERWCKIGTVNNNGDEPIGGIWLPADVVVKFAKLIVALEGKPVVRIGVNGGTVDMIDSKPGEVDVEVYDFDNINIGLCPSCGKDGWSDLDMCASCGVTCEEIDKLFEHHYESIVIMNK